MFKYCKEEHCTGLERRIWLMCASRGFVQLLGDATFVRDSWLLELQQIGEDDRANHGSRLPGAGDLVPRGLHGSLRCASCLLLVLA